MADITIDGTTIGANRFLFLDSTGKIPAVDGSQVTAIAAGNIATGTIPVARIDTGSTANKIVVLDGSGRLPAVSGALLTNVSSSTKSSSDPTISTNPSGGVGTEWHNTTSGEAYICTDATAGENVWTNIGAGTGDIEPWIYQGTQFGYTSGSGDPTSLPAGDAIEKHSYTSDGNATDHANLSRQRGDTNGHSSGTHGYLSGGGGAPNTFIEKFPFASQTNSVSTGFYLSTGTVVRSNSAMSSDKYYGYCAGGSAHNVIDRISYSTDGTATDVGDVLSGQTFGMAGASSETYGYAAGGAPPGTNVIQKFAFGSSANATDVGDLTTVIIGATGHQSATHGYKAGGSQSDTYTTSSSSIQKWSFASDASATNVGTTTVGRYMHASGSSTTHGYSSAGSNAVGGNVIEKFPFASDSNATDVGDLVISRSYLSGQQY